MRIFRRRTIFHIEYSTPDQEELKWRFRRRVFFFSLFVFFLSLGYPVIRDLQVPLELRKKARKFGELVLETRLLATQMRAPITLLLESGHHWKRIFHASGSTCESHPVGPYEEWNDELEYWHLTLQKENGESIHGTRICMDPLLGFSLDSHALADGKLLITLASTTAPISALSQAFLLLSNGGADVQAFSLRK